MAGTYSVNTNLIAKLAELRITEEDIRACKLPAYEQSGNLVQADDDMFGRTQLMTPATLTSWQNLKKAAQDEGITLLLVSAFRSIDYQCELIAAKLERGQKLSDILSVNAIPGFSEHHTGRALDINTPDCEPLSEAFEETPAFIWLEANASRYEFGLSFPRDNECGISYEPWHWAWRLLD